MKSIKLAAVGALAFLSAAPAQAADPIAGRWITEEREAVVQIYTCGNRQCGKLVKYLVSPPDGVDQRDIYNPNKSLRNRKVLGTPLLTDLKPDGDLWRGDVYDPKSGKSYRAVVKRLNSTTLKVWGCIGPFCETTIWKRG